MEEVKPDLANVREEGNGDGAGGEGGGGGGIVLVVDVGDQLS